LEPPRESIDVNQAIDDLRRMVNDLDED
jgi:hypothetical protein